MLGIAAVATTAAIGGGEQTQQPGAAAADPTCDFFVLNSGVDGGTFICASQHGNVTSYNSPFGFEHINVATIAEGYLLCYDRGIFVGRDVAFDHGFAEVGWGPAAVTSFSPLTIVRNTSDNVMELRQTFIPNAARHEVVIQNRVRNISRGQVTDVVFARSVDFDIDNDTLNWHAADDRDAYFAWTDRETDSPPDAHMMSLAQHPGSGAPRNAMVNTNYMDTACNGTPLDSPVETDATGRIEYNIGTLNSGVSRTPTVIYNRH
jgi:hypothetical protein